MTASGPSSSPQPAPRDVAELAARLGRALDPDQADKLAAYLGLLAKWNRSVNLVGRQGWQDVLTDLVADSWHVADFLAALPGLPDNPLTLDPGAGAGLPGIPLRLFWTPGEYHLIEVRAKRVAFLRMALARLGLERTHVAEGRVEDVAPRIGPADLMLSRAFMPWPALLDLAASLAAPGGTCVVMASQPPPDEAGRVGPWRLVRAGSYPAPGGERWLWAFGAS